MISEGALSAKVVLVGAQGTNCDPEGPSRFLIFSLCYNGKKLFTPYGPPWAPPWLWAPGKSSGCPTLSPGLANDIKKGSKTCNGIPYSVENKV